MTDEQVWIDNTHSFPWCPIKHFDNFPAMWEDILQQSTAAAHYLWTPLECHVSIRHYREDKTIDIKFIVVRHQRKGHGTQMLKMLAEHALSQGFSVILSGPYAPGARKIAEKLGMARQGPYRQYTINPTMS